MIRLMHFITKKEASASFFVYTQYCMWIVLLPDDQDLFIAIVAFPVPGKPSLKL